jgi:CheY-like chemotaxis protein
MSEDREILRLSERSLLVVEDDESVLRLMRLTLARGNHKAEFVTSKEEAVEKLNDRTNIYDLVVTDLGLPEGADAGFDVAKVAKEKRPGIGVIIFTGSAPRAEDFMARNPGTVDVVIAKPFSPNAFNAKIDEYFKAQ